MVHLIGAKCSKRSTPNTYAKFPDTIIEQVYKGMAIVPHKSTSLASYQKQGTSAVPVNELVNKKTTLKTGKSLRYTNGISGPSKTSMLTPFTSKVTSPMLL